MSNLSDSKNISVKVEMRRISLCYVHVTPTFSCSASLEGMSQQCRLVSWNLKAREVPSPRPHVWFLVTSRSMPWVKEVRGWVVFGEEREGWMDAGCDVTTWPWQGHRSRCTQADTHQTQSFSLHGWIILIWVWQKVNICHPSWAVHARVERGFWFEVYIESD